MTQPWCRTVVAEGRFADPGRLGEPPSGQGVAWASAAPESDLHRLRAWRRAVGPAWLRQGGGATRPGPPLVAASWNARTGGGALRAFWRRLLSESPAPGLPTVVLLQEVFSAGRHVPKAASSEAAETARPRWAWAERIADGPPGEDRTDVVAFAREEGLSLAYVPSMRNGGPSPAGDDGTEAAGAAPREDRGCAILANVPLLSPLAVELPFERQRRVAVVAQVDMGRARAGLCSVHLDNRAPWRRAWRSLGRARERQMAGLLRALAALGLLRPLDDDPPLPGGGRHFDAPWGTARFPPVFVLGGDFNTWTRGRREAAYKLARRRFPHPKTLDARPTHRFEVGGFLRSSDHLLFALSPGWRAEGRRMDDMFGSDHYPLAGTLQRS